MGGKCVKRRGMEGRKIGGGQGRKGLKVEGRGR